MNEALTDLFECFVIDRTDAGIAVLPVLLESTPLSVEVGEGRASDANGATRWHLTMGHVTDENFESWGGLTVREDEQIVPPLRRIEAPSGEFAERQE